VDCDDVLDLFALVLMIVCALTFVAIVCSCKFPESIQRVLVAVCVGSGIVSAVLGNHVWHKAFVKAWDSEKERDGGAQ